MTCLAQEEQFVREGLNTPFTTKPMKTNAASNGHLNYPFSSKKTVRPNLLASFSFILLGTFSTQHDCAEVFYQSAFRRVLTRVFNLRISHPLEDIIAYKDDLVTAFRRVRYHPDISCAHAFVFESFLILPIGLVFGARGSPAWFCQVSELQAFASQHLSTLGLPIPDQTLIDSVSFEDNDSHD